MARCDAGTHYCIPDRRRAHSFCSIECAALARLGRGADGGNPLLSEPQVSESEPHRYVVLITDGIDDVGAQPVRVHSGTRIRW